ncbi:MAG: hypothetical protein HRT61_05790 [Ekhidna sp.]|nr:hypothetical protein [Ekhidna sp.]
MKKEDFEIYAIDYLKGELRPDQVNEFERLLTDQELRQQLEDLRGLTDLASSWKNETPPANMRSEFYTSLAEHQQEEVAKPLSMVERFDAFLGSLSQYKNIKRLAFSSILLLIGGLVGYSLRGSSGNAEVVQLSEQIAEMQVNIAKIQLKSYAPSDRMKGITYVSQQASHSDELLETLLSSLIDDESAHIRIATAQALYKFHRHSEIQLALEKALLREKDSFGKMNLISLVETFNPELAIKEKNRLLDGTRNPQLREALESNKIKLN